MAFGAVSRIRTLLSEVGENPISELKESVPFFGVPSKRAPHQMEGGGVEWRDLKQQSSRQSLDEFLLPTRCAGTSTWDAGRRGGGLWDLHLAGRVALLLRDPCLALT